VEAHRAVLRDLVDLERDLVDDRQVAAVDHARLGGRDHLAPGHRHGVAAQPVDGVAEHLGLLHADLGAAQVLGLDDRFLAVQKWRKP
jgi:hypothetical protein